ncbi:MAG: c-type cytochrome, partial [Bacteroidota bacterium]
EAAISGKSIMLSLDCKSCHKEAETSIGPSFLKVSEKYAKDANAPTYLAQKIIKGGSGVWGEVAMAAHPTLPQNDINQIVQWVLSLSNKASVKKSLPQSGNITPAEQKPRTSLVLSASYTDKGGNNIKALTGRTSVALNSNFLTFNGSEKTDGFKLDEEDGVKYMVIPDDKQGWFGVENIDLTGVKSINIMAGWEEPPLPGYDFEIRLDAPDGKVLGKASLMPTDRNNPKERNIAVVNVKIEPVTDGSMHKLYVTASPKDKTKKTKAGIGALEFNSK